MANKPRSNQQYYPPPPDHEDDAVSPLRVQKATASPSPSAKSSSSRQAQDSATNPQRTASGRYKFTADDPHRPSVSGYGQPPPPTSRYHAPRKQLPESPGPDTPEKDTTGPGYPISGPGSSGSPMPVADQYMPRPVDTTESNLSVPDSNRDSQGRVNRVGTHTSVHTTKAERGSPPPPETPVDPPQAAPPMPLAYAQQGTAPRRPAPYPTAAVPVTTQQQPTATNQQVLSGQAVQGLSLDELPPAYSTHPLAQAAGQQYPDEKGQMPPVPVPGAAAVPLQPSPQAVPPARPHPAFANDPPQAAVPSHPAAAGLAPVQLLQPQPQAQQVPLSAATTLASTSPPPLPEGWIAHLDPNSGQYYYIHLPTQHTQWDFPKGPNPNLREPLSPASTYAKPVLTPAYSQFPSKPMLSPGFPSPGYPPQYATYNGSIGTVAGMASPTSTVFSGPPPTAGVEMYQVAPTNGVYFGPYLRYTNIDLERCLWLGSILVITDAPHPPTIHIHQSTDLSPNPRQLKANPIYSHRGWLIYRYDIDLLMEEHPTKWTYAVTSHLGCTRYEFLVAGRHDTNWRFITHSGNDFSLNVNANERAKVGGLSLMWQDILQKHQECGGFHAQIGLGGQIYADRLWQDVPMLKQWITISGKENRRNAPWTAKHEEDVLHAYFHFYTSHFDQPHLREAFAQIPNILTIDDHDIFDGYGSYPEYMQQSHMFKNIGRIGIDMSLLFQHHTTHEILRNVNNDLDLFTITGSGWHFLKYLGPAVVVVGPDTRSERTPTQVLAGPTYQGILPKVATLPPIVQHCLWLFPVPLIYPRLHSATQIANTVAQGKKAVTGTFNMLGKVTSSVAGIVGAKDMVNDGFHSVKKAVGKSGLMSGMLSPFGELDVLDELRDLWTHDSKDLERTYVIRTLQGISHNKSLRMTFLSGAVNCAGAGLVHDPAHPHDHRTMYQLISSAVVNAPPSSMVLRLLNTNPKQPIYVPLNGRRSAAQNAANPPPPTDTKEDMLEIFVADPDGRPRDMKRLMGRRNYVAMVAYDPDAMAHGAEPKAGGGGDAGGRLSLAADFLVQQDVGAGYAGGGSVKYGPVVIPSLEYGR